MSNRAKIILFGVAALLLLFAGYAAAQALWITLHHRYSRPETGYYNGSVRADFDENRDGLYWLRFEGKSEARWYSRQPTNFVYTHLILQLHSFDDQANMKESRATVDLPSMNFRSAETNATLSADLLATLLLRKGERNTNSLQQMEAIMSYIRAAGEGRLPAPNHHGHYFDEPLRVQIMHFHLGPGIGWTVYAWLTIWGILVVFAAWRVFKKPAAERTPTALPSS
jgi:hypothetical protein